MERKNVLSSALLAAMLTVASEAGATEMREANRLSGQPWESLVYGHTPFAGEAFRESRSDDAVTQAPYTAGLPAPGQDGGGVAGARPTSNPASAAEGSPKVADLNRVVVTGSRLNLPGVESVIPVQQLDRQEIIESGHMDMTEALRDLPGVAGSDSLTTNQGSHQGNGLSTIALRGLGLARTLVLIDGRRTVSSAGNRNVVSLSSIPEYLVDRVEVSTGGASAVYGSDAIAGVVNIITESRMEGVKARVVNRTTDDGGGGSMEYSLGAGTKLLDDRLHMMGAVTYSDQKPLRATQRDFAMRSASYSATTNRLTSPNLSDYTPGGRYGGNAYYYDEDGLHPGFVRAVDGFEMRNSGILVTPRKMLNAGGKMTFDIHSDLRLFGQLMYSKVDTAMDFEPVTSGYSETYGLNGEFTVGRIPRSNHFAPTAISGSAGAEGINWFRRFNELGRRQFDNSRVTWRGSTGFQGTIADKWDWDVVYSLGYFDGHQVSKNYLNLAHLNQALNTAVVGGAVVCADPVARAAGCLPVNVFGVGAISPDAANYIRSDKDFRARNRQHTVEASVAGSPFSLPAGPVQTAFGIEWRKDQTGSRTDSLTQQGLSSGPFIPNFTGEISSSAMYGEANFPLLSELPLAHDLSVEVAARVTHYPELRNVGTTFSYRGGIQWSPLRKLTFRAAYGIAERAPYTTELYSPPRDGYATVVDVCRDVSASTPGQIAANCRLEPGIAAAIAQHGQFVQDSTYVFVPNSGNINLKQEAAHTFTAGMLFSPWRGMDASIDYYDIKIKDAIGSISIPNLMTECYGQSGGIGNKFCQPIRRNAEGEIIRIDNQQQNLDRMRASGIDVAFNQRFTLGPVVPGKFTLNAAYTYRDKLYSMFEGVQGVKLSSTNGQVGNFRNEARAGLAWSHKGLRLKWTTVYMHKAVDSIARKELFESLGTNDPLFLNIPSFVRHDLNVSVSPFKLGAADWRVFGNVLNVFNRYSPYLPDGTASGGRYNYNPAYGVSGRTFSLGVEMRL